MFVKHFVRFNTREELDDYDVIELKLTYSFTKKKMRMVLSLYMKLY